MCATCLAALAVGVPEAPAQQTGSFLGVQTKPGGTATFTLPAGKPFPQAAREDVYLAGETTVTVTNGMEYDFYWTLPGSFGSDVGQGTMRFTVFQADDGDRHLASIVGTFTMDIGDEDGPLLVSGPVVGDQSSFYLASRVTFGPGPLEAIAFLIRADIAGMGGTNPLSPTYLSGPTQFLALGTAGGGVRALTDVLTATYAGGGDMRNLAAPGFTSGSTFNQISPADGSGDVVFGAETAGFFVSGFTMRGTIGGAGQLTTVGNALMYDPTGGVDSDAEGFFLDRFTYVLGGKTLQGLLVGDMGAKDSGTRPFDGFIFSLATPDSAPTFLFGTVGGSYTDSGTMTLTPAAAFFKVNIFPPEPWYVGENELDVSGYRDLWTPVRDLNGWDDVKSVSMVINTSKATNRIAARYFAAKDKLFLYNPALKKWVGGCRPGASGTIKTPYVSLNCKDTKVRRWGENLIIGWNLKPTAKMLGNWFLYLKVDDNAGLVWGWNDFNNDLGIWP